MLYVTAVFTPALILSGILVFMIYVEGLRGEGYTLNELFDHFRTEFYRRPVEVIGVGVGVFFVVNTVFNFIAILLADLFMKVPV